MAERSGLEQQLRQRTHLTQQQVRYARMLELTAPELDEAVQRELEDNPALEVKSEDDENEKTDDGEKFEETSEELQRADYADDDDTPYYRLEARNRSRDDRIPDFSPADTAESLYDILTAQLRERNLDDEHLAAAERIIGNLDSNGYLRRTLSGIADDIALDIGLDISPETVAEALETVQQLEPPGIAARDLRECLLIQLRRLPASSCRNNALNIIDKAFDSFSMKHYHRLVSLLNITMPQVEEAISLIVTLNPKPGASLGTGPGENAQPIIPDYIIEVNDGEITVTLNNRNTDLQISESFEGAVMRMEQNARNRRKKGSEFIISRYNEARDFIKILKMRQETLFAVMTSIVRRQKEFFLTDDVHTLRPMLIKDVAADTGYDLSVISRATNNKHVLTPRGIFPLRFFFSDSLGDEQGGFTSKAIEDIISQLVENEDKLHPLSDEALRKAIAEQGYDLSRRTIAKYRDRMGIPVARLRRRL